MKPFKNPDLVARLFNTTRRVFPEIGGGDRGDRPGASGRARRRPRPSPTSPIRRDDDLETVVTSCAHNCGSRHMLVAHKKGDVIVRLSTDNGTYQGDAYGTDTEEKPQLRACLRGRSYRRGSTRRSGCSTR